MAMSSLPPLTEPHTHTMGESLFRYQTFWQLFIRPSREAGFRPGHNHLHVAGLENDMVHALVASTNLTLPHLTLPVPLYVSLQLQLVDAI